MMRPEHEDYGPSGEDAAPGEMIAADLHNGVVLDSEAIDAINRARAPYKRWLKQGMTYLHSELIDPSLAAEPFDHETLARFQKLFQLTREEREQVLRPLADMFTTARLMMIVGLIIVAADGAIGPRARLRRARWYAH